MISEVSFKSNPEAWRVEKYMLNCTVRSVDDDERFQSLKQGKVTKVSITNTVTGEKFTRPFLIYHEFDSGALGFEPGRTLCKIGWEHEVR